MENKTKIKLITVLLTFFISLCIFFSAYIVNKDLFLNREQVTEEQVKDALDINETKTKEEISKKQKENEEKQRRKKEKIEKSKKTIDFLTKSNRLPRMYKKALNSMHFNNNFFGIDNVVINLDRNKNGIDDLYDIYVGAKLYCDTKPTYSSEQYEGGYPPPEIGVCTDVIWNALFYVGYALKDNVDSDIKNYTKEYKNIKVPEPDIDFRRVTNLEVFFKRNAKELTTDTSRIEEWQAGDIIIYHYPTSNHIGIVSEKRNYKGIPFLVHHGGRAPAGEYNTLDSEYIYGHYRMENIL